MKKMSVLILCSFLMSGAFAGNEAGGGGHICKSKAALYFDNVVETINNNSETLQNFPEWKKLQFVMNPSKNPGFKIEITASPIKNCPNTENALACGQPNKNKIQIYCGEDGWNSLDLKEKYKQIIHEIYWWSDLDDTNYFYSEKLLNEVFDTIQSKALVRQKYLTLRKGDVESLEVSINSIDFCEPINIYGNSGRWENINGALTCNPPAKNTDYQSCTIDFSLNYTVEVNKDFSIEVNKNSKLLAGANQGTLPVGTVFSNDRCKSSIRKNIFPAESLAWFQEFEEVQSEEPSRYKNSCYKKIFQGAFDPTSGSIGAYVFKSLETACGY